MIHHSCGISERITYERGPLGRLNRLFTVIFLREKKSLLEYSEEEIQIKHSTHWESTILTVSHQKPLHKIIGRPKR